MDTNQHMRRLCGEQIDEMMNGCMLIDLSISLSLSLSLDVTSHSQADNINKLIDSPVRPSTHFMPSATHTDTDTHVLVRHTQGSQSPYRQSGRHGDRETDGQQWIKEPSHLSSLPSPPLLSSPLDQTDKEV